MKKYYIHREGRRIICFTFIFCLAIALLSLFSFSIYFVKILCCTLAAVLFFAVLAFFRIPKRSYPTHQKNSVVASADGVIVDIAKVKDPEYFDDERIRVSIFMSPANVHVNRYPIDGEIVYTKYHKGRYLVAWHPKSSTMNERNTTVIRTDDGQEVLVRQIAGAMARRIVSYAVVGNRVEHGQELGFIKFGSRVDIFLPTTAEILVEMEEKVKSGLSLIAQI